MKKENFSPMSYSAIKWIQDVHLKPSELHSYITSLDDFFNLHLLSANINNDFDYDEELNKIKKDCSLNELSLVEIVQKNKILQQKFLDYKNNENIHEISIEKIDLYNLLIELRNQYKNLLKKPNSEKTKSYIPKKIPKKKNLKLLITKEKTNKVDDTKEKFKSKIFKTCKIQFTKDLKRNKDLNHYVEKSKKKSLYNRLGCNRSCSLEEISNKYKIISKILHPDKNIDVNEKYTHMINEAFQNISFSFNILNSFRQNYDLLLNKFNGDLEKVDEEMKLYPFINEN